MDRTLEAIFERGVFKPLEKLSIPEHQRVLLTIHLPPIESAEKELDLWQQVFAGLSNQDIVEIESVALDRSNFLPQER